MILLVLVLALAAWLVYDKASRPRTAYILIEDVYNKFQMKNELERDFLKTKQKRQSILDSLALAIRALERKLAVQSRKDPDEIEAFNVKRAEFFDKQRTFEEDNMQLSKQYEQQIFSQISHYLQDYGKEQGYEYIFGNNGDGSLMYAMDSNNITEEVIKYINTKYQGL